MMVKVVGLVKRRPGMSQEDFRRYWLEHHSRLERASLRVNPVRKIVATFWQENLIGDAPFDGMVELYFDSHEAMRQQWSGSHDGTMRADEANFCDPNYRIFVLSEEVVIGERLGDGSVSASSSEQVPA